MSDRTTLEIIASTVEEALSQGLAQLGLTADAVSVEVLDSGSKGLFGFGGRQVRIRLTVNQPQAAPAPSPQTRQSGYRQPERSTSNETGTQVNPSHPQNPPPQQAPSPEKKKPVPHSPDANLDQEKPALPATRLQPHTPDPLLDASEEIVSKLISHLGMKAQVSAHFDETSSDDRRIIQVDVHGDNLSALIGRHAETLTAFQHVASLMVGKQTQQWVQLVVDVEGYRERREKQVRQIALRMAEQVIKTGRKATLEPMSASERRAIHIELRGHPAVITESTGEEPFRKVVILPKK